MMQENSSGNSRRDFGNTPWNFTRRRHVLSDLVALRPETARASKDAINLRLSTFWGSRTTAVQSILAFDTKRETKGAGVYGGGKGVGRVYLGNWARDYEKKQYPHGDGGII